MRPIADSLQSIPSSIISSSRERFLLEGRADSPTSLSSFWANSRDTRLNSILLMEVQQRGRQTEAYEEVKRLLVFAGLFFLFAIAFVLMRFQVSIDDVFKWSPVIWLLGVIICGLIMNLFFQIRSFFKARAMKRERERHNLLLSLRIPDSFPCLAPSGTHCCHWHSDHLARDGGNAASAELPSYDQSARYPLLSPPAFVLHIPTRRASSNGTQTAESAPPKYRESLAALAAGEADGESQNGTEELPPNYEAEQTGERRGERGTNV